jgi:type II secretory pathway pseudopilin PulG
MRGRQGRMPDERRGSGDGGFTVIETVVSTALLGILVLTVLQGLLYGITNTRTDVSRSGAAAWAQSELDYLRLEGYGNLTVPTSRTLTASSGYTSFGSVSEPTIPANFDHALVSIQAVAGLSADQVTVTLYQSPSVAYATYATYIGNYTHP